MELIENFPIREGAFRRDFLNKRDFYQARPFFQNKGCKEFFEKNKEEIIKFSKIKESPFDYGFISKLDVFETYEGIFFNIEVHKLEKTENGFNSAGHVHNSYFCYNSSGYKEISESDDEFKKIVQMSTAVDISDFIRYESEKGKIDFVDIKVLKTDLCIALTLYFQENIKPSCVYLYLDDLQSVYDAWKWSICAMYIQENIENYVREWDSLQVKEAGNYEVSKIDTKPYD